jgi:hypothetical protein
MLTERQQGISEHFVVGFDRDAKQFLLFDADDPGYEAFSTTGWVGQEMILTSIDRPDRIKGSSLSAGRAGKPLGGRAISGNGD